MAKTALDLTPQEWRAYKPRQRQAQLSHRASLLLAKRRRQAWRIARRAAQVLRKDFGARRVVVFGSLAHGAWFHAHSDIDLAVEGLPPGSVWRAWSAIEQVEPSIQVDLIELETATDRLRQRIQEQGKEL